MRLINDNELLSLTAAGLGLQAASRIDDLLKPALRRGCYLLAPCSSADLLRYVVEPMGGGDEMRSAAEQALEELLTYGDLLEMRRTAQDAWDVPTVALRPAPPAFVLRSPHEAIILGVAGDFPHPLPDDLAEMLSYDGAVRILNCPNDPELGPHLRSLGLTELKESSWLRLPASVGCAEHVDGWRARLAVAAPCAPLIEGLEIIAPEKSPRFYRGRWRAPQKSDTGTFVGRRPQAYGSKLWSVVALEAGEARRIIDLMPTDAFERGCDIAWRLQAALDAERGSPQSVELIEEGDLSYLNFFGPLPAFAERRLALVATKAHASGSLFRFTIPTAKLQTEVASLESRLWMQPTCNGGKR